MVSKVSLQRNSQSRNDRHMGLFNLGCICYINSIMQQLHMIAPFRQGLLNICLPEHT